MLIQVQRISVLLIMIQLISQRRLQIQLIAFKFVEHLIYYNITKIYLKPVMRSQTARKKMPVLHY